MALRALRAVLTAALDEVDQLFAFDLVDHSGLNSSTRHKRRTKHRLVATDHQNFVELNGFTRCSRQFFNAQNVTRLHFILFAACL